MLWQRKRKTDDRLAHQEIILTVRRSPRSPQFREEWRRHPNMYPFWYWPSQILTIGTKAIVNDVGHRLSDDTVTIHTENLADTEMQQGFWGTVFAYGNFLIQSTGGGDRREVSNQGYQRPKLVKSVTFALKGGQVSWRPGTVYKIREALGLLLVPVFYTRNITLVFLMLGLIAGLIPGISESHSISVIIYQGLRGLLFADLVVLAGMVLGFIIPN